MKLHKLLEDSPLMGLEGKTLEADGFNVTIDKIREVHQGDAKGVIVYGSLDGCPYCDGFEPKWKDACDTCPKGVFTVKVMMEDIPEHHHAFGTKPRMYPSVYGFVRGKNGRVQRYDYSQDRDRLNEIMGAISSGHTVEPTAGAIEDVWMDTPGHHSMMMESQFHDEDDDSSSSDEDDEELGQGIKFIELNSLEEEGSKKKSPAKKRRTTQKKSKSKSKSATSRKTLSKSKNKNKSKSKSKSQSQTKKRSRK
jgi:hypothetical protein